MLLVVITVIVLAVITGEAADALADPPASLETQLFVYADVFWEVRRARDFCARCPGLP